MLTGGFPFSASSPLDFEFLSNQFINFVLNVKNETAWVEVRATVSFGIMMKRVCAVTKDPVVNEPGYQESISSDTIGKKRHY